jgi:hypothetical protein
MREAPKQATDNAGAAAPGALWKRALRWFWAHPVQTVVLLVAVQTLPTLWSKDIWIVDESRHAAALVQMLEHGHWLMLHLGENLYPDKPPLYFWLAGLIALAAGTTDPWVMSAATAIGAALFAAATVQMTLTLGLGRRLALVAGLVIVTAQHFLIREHMPRMDLMYGALIVYAQLVFYAATKRPEGQRAGTYALAFFLSALAVLTKGPLAPLLCLAVLGSYLLCLGRVKELWRREFALGSLGLILPSAAYTEKNGLYVNTEGRVQMGQRAVFPKGEAKEDWAIFRALSARLGKTLPYDDLNALRAKLFGEIESFGQIDHAPGSATAAEFDPAQLGEAGDVLDAPFASPITDFYLTNPVARASKTMAECSALVADARAELQAAE